MKPISDEKRGLTAKAEAALRNLKAATFDELVDAMRLALGIITASDISGWFKHCGYTINN